MIGAISGFSSLSYYNPYVNNRAGSVDQGAQASQTTQASRIVGAKISWRGAAPETPVEPVRRVSSILSQEPKPRNNTLPVIREGADPAEMSVRMRIQYDQPEQEGAQTAALSQAADKEAGNVSGLPGNSDKGGEHIPGLPGNDDKGAEHIPGLPDAHVLGEEDESTDGVNEEEETAAGAEGAQEAAEEGKCETCAKRKYQDESDDPGVSFQTPTKLGPRQAASAVRGHEMEHVVREQAKARREDRRVVSQSVTYHTAICPECGKVYVSGGTTRTVTAANSPWLDVDNKENDRQKKTPASFFSVT